MKNFFKTLFAGLALASLLALPVLAAPADPPINVFATSTTNANSTLSTAIITARSGNAGTPVVKFLSVSSDKVTSKVQGYKITAQTTCTFTNTTVTIPVSSTNQGVNWNSGTVVIRHLVDDSYEKRTLTSNTGATNIVVTAASVGTVVPGDILYFATTTGAPSLLWGASTNTLSATGGILVGQPNKPFLVEIDATGSLGNLYLVSGDFVPPPIAPRPGL